MVPVTYVIIDQMPLTPHGKIDRRALPIPHASDRMRIGGSAPKTETERTICALWAELLRLPEIGIDDNFFDLGGHSLLVFRFNSAAREEFGVEIPVRVLFEKPTVREFARWLDIYNASAEEETVGAGEELFL